MPLVKKVVYHVQHTSHLLIETRMTNVVLKAQKCTGEYILFEFSNKRVKNV